LNRAPRNRGAGVRTISAKRYLRRPKSGRAKFLETSNAQRKQSHRADADDQD
jgi:hypothetical protein